MVPIIYRAFYQLDIFLRKLRNILNFKLIFSSRMFVLPTNIFIEFFVRTCFFMKNFQIQFLNKLNIDQSRFLNIMLIIIHYYDMSRSVVTSADYLVSIYHLTPSTFFHHFNLYIRFVIGNDK